MDVPIFHLDYVLNVWDPLSSTQTHLVVNFIQQLIDNYPTLTHSHQNLCNGVVKRIQIVLEKDIFIPTFSSQ